MSYVLPMRRLNHYSLDVQPLSPRSGFYLYIMMTQTYLLFLSICSRL